MLWLVGCSCSAAPTEILFFMAHGVAQAPVCRHNLYRSARGSQLVLLLPGDRPSNLLLIRRGVILHPITQGRAPVDHSLICQRVSTGAACQTHQPIQTVVLADPHRLSSTIYSESPHTDNQRKGTSGRLQT